MISATGHTPVELQWGQALMRLETGRALLIVPQGFRAVVASGAAGLPSCWSVRVTSVVKEPALLASPACERCRGSLQHRTSRRAGAAAAPVMSDDRSIRAVEGVWPAEDLDPMDHLVGRRSQLDEQDLVLVFRDQAAEGRSQPNMALGREIAAEDRELHVLAEAVERLVHLPPTLGAGDVVGDEVGVDEDRLTSPGTRGSGRSRRGGAGRGGAPGSRRSSGSSPDSRRPDGARPSSVGARRPPPRASSRRA